MVWEVANVVFVLEENWGFGVMKKSRDLIKGKRDTTLALNILYLLIMGGIEGYFQYGVVQGRDELCRIIWRRTTLLAALRCGFDLFWLLIRIVFYLECKSIHHKRIDKLALSDHLEAYLRKYMPLKTRKE
ncbi:uncharacterized protein LOC131860391 [Cryptomeria japonica]|uniref:uncharacterized protein LOC131860391 n=1 Tax=Cryptomeria japonica TaxID=3369 RepID=UPI0027DA6563|nr:uncharacterized protein LOC131860391 [Cryptomeria japonica]